jgi:hypothetical protein
MVTLAGWLGIAFNRPRLVRTYAIIFGLGAGLIGDEVGLLLTLGDYQSSLTTDFFVGVVGFIILASTLVRYRKIVRRDVIHTSWNERLIYIGINLIGLSAIFFAVNSLTSGLVLASIGVIFIIAAFEAARAGIAAGIISGFGSEFGLLYDTISVLIGLIAYLAYGNPTGSILPKIQTKHNRNQKRPGWAIDVQGKRVR